MALPTFQLVCFGSPTARIDGAPPPPDVLWRKHLALLIYLALSPDQRRSREHLIGLLWPEKTQDKARHSLNEAVRRLRASLGAQRLQSRGESVRLTDGQLEVDVWDFERMAPSDPRGAVELLRGDFLEGFGIEGAAAFEDWATAQRARFRAAGTNLLLTEGESALVGNRFDDAQEFARRALTLHPSSEPAANLFMRTSALVGDAAGALGAFHQFEGQLLREMGEQPSKELQDLAERVRSERWRHASSRYERLEPPLIGRTQVHRDAFALLEEGTKSGAQCLVVSGDPGMGKTRLLNECVDRLALSGAIVAEARLLESDHDAPWSTLRHLARSGLASASGAAAADPRALSVLASLVPELGERFDPTEPRDNADVASALQSLVRAVADEQPVALAIDDAHFADGPTIGALWAAIRNLDQSRVVVVATVDPAVESAPRELLRFRGDIGRGVAGRTVRLDPLTEDDMREVATNLATWVESQEDLDRLARRLSHEAEGVPFLAITLLRGLERASTLKEDFMTQWPIPTHTLESPLPFSVPELARLAIITRVSELEPESQRVLGAASILGMALDTSLIAALTELPTDQVDELLERLEQRRFLTYDGGRYRFMGALLVQVVRGECLTPGQRERMRKRAIAELATRGELESRVLRAELMAKVQPGEDVFEEAMTVAREALESGSSRTARRALFAAGRAAGQDKTKRALVDKARSELVR